MRPARRSSLVAAALAGVLGCSAADGGADRRVRPPPSERPSSVARPTIDRRRADPVDAARRVRGVDRRSDGALAGRPAEIFRRLVDRRPRVGDQLEAFEQAAIRSGDDARMSRSSGCSGSRRRSRRRLSTATAESASVDVWTVSILGAPDAGSPQQVWRTVHVDLELDDGRWLVVAAATADAGPTPAANELALQSGWDDFDEWRAGRRSSRESGCDRVPMPMWPWDPIVDAVTAPFKAAAGWAWDTVIGGITDWLAKGFVQLVSFVWDVMDRSTSPALDSEWFARLRRRAVPDGGRRWRPGLLLIFLFCALIQGILAGRPLELVKRMAFDTPAAVAGILFTVAFTQVGIDLVDAMSDGIWR